jgi:hypothetical protein
MNVHIYLGFNYPFDLGSKVSDIIRSVGLGFNQVNVSAISHLGQNVKILFEKEYNGGPKNYPQKLRENNRRKKNTKQRLFEVMARLDSTFKPKLNENFGNEEFDANQEPSYGFNPEEHPPISDEPETDQNNIVDTVKNGDFMIKVIEQEGMYGGEVYWKNKFVKFLPLLPNNTRERIIKRFKEYSDNVTIKNHPRYDNKVFYIDDQSERIIDID